MEQPDRDAVTGGQVRHIYPQVDTRSDSSGSRFYNIEIFRLPPECVDIIEESKKAREEKIEKLLSVGNNNELKNELTDIKLLFDEAENLYKEHLIISQKYFLKPSEKKSDANDGQPPKFSWDKTVNKNIKYKNEYIASLNRIWFVQGKLEKYSVSFPFEQIRKYEKEEKYKNVFIDFKCERERGLNLFINKKMCFNECSIFFNTNRIDIVKCFNLNPNCNIKKNAIYF